MSILISPSVSVSSQQMSSQALRMLLVINWNSLINDYTSIYLSIYIYIYIIINNNL